MKLWIGNEKEGKYKGLRTLFVGASNVSFMKIMNILEKDSSIKQVYFGAGKCTKGNYSVMRQLIRTRPIIITTIEIDFRRIGVLPDDIIRDAHNIIVTINKKGLEKLDNLISNKTQLKLQNLTGRKKIILCELKKFTEVNVEEHIDKTYKGDEVIE